MVGSPAPRFDMTAMAAKGVRLRLGTNSVLNGIDLQVGPGEVVGLIGRNGSGKSTLIRAMLGLFELDAGETFVFDEPALTMSDRVKERLAYVPQQPSALAWMQVENMFDYLHRFYPNWDGGYARAALERAEIPLHKPLGKLSPGERQRVELIRALAIRPELLVLDEPAAALDPAARRELLRDIAVRAGEGGTTVLFSTHIVSDLERVASRIVFIHQGRILFETRADDLKERFALLLISPDALPPGKIGHELHRRLLPDDTLSMVVERQPGENWPTFMQQPGAQLRILGLEDLFVEIVR